MHSPMKNADYEAVSDKYLWLPQVVTNTGMATLALLLPAQFPPTGQKPLHRSYHL